MIAMISLPRSVIWVNECTALGRLPPLFKSQAQVIKRGSVRVQVLAPGSEDTDELWREIQRVPELCLALAQRLRELCVLSHVDPGPDESVEHPAAGCRRADAPHMTN